MYTSQSNLEYAPSTNVSNSTLPTPPPPMTYTIEVMNFLYFVYIVSSRYVRPPICFIGVVGNVLSLIVLYKHGFNSSSNILLAALAVSDTVFLLGIVNKVAVYYSNMEWIGLGGSEVELLLLCYFRVVSYYFSEWGRSTSFTLPVLITTERLIAVFFPLHFKKIVTPGRTFLAVSILYILMLGHCVTDVVIIDCRYRQLVLPSNHTSGSISVRFDFNEWAAAINFASEFFERMIPLSFVTTGCVTIGIKLSITARKRAKMTRSKDTTVRRRTTFTLLAVCSVYSLAAGVAYITLVIHHIKQGKASLVFNIFLSRVSTNLICLNSACNFLIYVVTNAKFRKSYIALFLPKSKLNSRGKTSAEN